MFPNTTAMKEMPLSPKPEKFSPWQGRVGRLGIRASSSSGLIACWYQLAPQRQVSSGVFATLLWSDRE
jgi:hypothetical protein